MHAEKAEAVIRTMSPGDVSIAVEWARREGWNPGLHDAAAFHAADPDGFFMAEIAGEPVGCISAVAYDLHFGFLGLYIVAPERRGQGIGMRLWRHALAYLGERSVGADGVLERLDDYAREGFVSAYGNVRFQGRCAGGHHREFAPATAVSFERLSEYDRRHFPAERSRFLRRWIAQPGARALCALEGDDVRGYGVIRPCFDGWKIGPLFADTPGLATEFIAALTGQSVGDRFALDVPEPNAAGMALAAGMEMREVFRTGRIYSRQPPAIRLDGVFGVTSFELG